MRLSRCCNPVPGDDIIGYTTRGNGVGVHRIDCPNIKPLLDNKNPTPEAAMRAARLIEVAWNEEDLSASYEVELKIICRDRTHLLSDISNAIAAESVPILSGQMSSLKGVTAILIMRLEVMDQTQYERVVNRIKSLNAVVDVVRGA